MLNIALVFLGFVLITAIGGVTGGGAVIAAIEDRHGPAEARARRRGLPELRGAKGSGEFGGSLVMREEILEAAAAAGTPEKKLEAMRECIQAATLRSLHESGAFASICLRGKAADRFACGSLEPAGDLDFSLSDRKDSLFIKKNYRPEQWLFKAQRYLRFMGLDARIAFAKKTAVHAGWIKVTGLLAEAGLPSSSAEAIGFRISIIPEVPEGMVCKVKLVEAKGECFTLRWVVQ